MKKTRTVSFMEMVNKIDPMIYKNVVKQSQEQGTPIFTEADLKTTTHPLAQMVRMLFIKNNITQEKFQALHYDLAMRTFMSANNMNYERNNMKRSLVQNEITWNFFEKVLMVLGYDLTDITFTLFDKKTNEVGTISRSDVNSLLNTDPYHSTANISGGGLLEGDTPESLK